MNNNKNLVLRILVVVTFIIMVAVNALANILPINGIGTGDVSNYYENLFAPAPITFAIWGVIYILLFAFCVYYVLKINKVDRELREKLMVVGKWFTISSIANTVWIFAWHYDVIWLTLLLMVIILISLIRINISLRNKEYGLFTKIFVRIPFAVYFGWITVATIANVTTFLVYINWERFSLSEIFWADIIFIVGAVIGVVSILYYKSFSYGLVLIWAYSGIMIKHISEDGFNSEYMSAIISVALSLLLLITAEVLLLRINKNREKSL